MAVSEVLKLLKQHFARIWRSRFARNVLAIATGTAGAQVISMAFSPLITRLYGPEAIGLLGIFIALTAIVTPIAALTYPVAIVLPKDDIDALGIARLSVYLSFAISALFSLALWMGGDRLISVLRADKISAFIFLIPLSMLFYAWMQIVGQWLIRKKEFRLYARVTVVQSLIQNSAKTGVGWFHPIAAVLLIVTTFGNLLNALLLFFGANLRYRKSTTETHQAGEASIRQLAYKYKDFPLYRAPQNLINAASQALPTLMLASFFGPSSAGFYSIGNNVLSVPIALVGQSVGTVFYSRIAAAAHNNENVQSLVISATLGLASIAFFPFAVVFLFGPQLFGYIFGPDWVMAGKYARWMSLWLFFLFINKPSVNVVPVLDLQKEMLCYEIIVITARMLALLVGFYFYKSDLYAIALFSLTGACLNIILIIWVILKSAQHIRCTE